jgi:hypothetical protein
VESIVQQRDMYRSIAESVAGDVQKTPTGPKVTSTPGRKPSGFFYTIRQMLVKIVSYVPEGVLISGLKPYRLFERRFPG